MKNSTLMNNIPLVISVIFGTTGIPCIILGGFLSLNSYHLLKEGVPARGEVIELVGRRGSKGGTTYAPLYEFKATDGKTYTILSSTSSNPPSHQVGDQISVLYPKGNPEKAEINAFLDLWLGPIIAGLIGVIFTAIATGMIISHIRKQQLRAWLKQNGQRVPSEFQGVEENMSIRVNRRHPFQIVTTWKDPVGTVHRFTSDNLWENPTNLLQGRKTMDVLINPNDPTKYWMDTSFLSP
jgi:hypothetical protein